MRNFKGPRYQGGWIAVAAAAAAAAYDSYESGKQRDEAREDSKEMSAGDFKRRAWLDQQQRKFALEDRRYKEDAIAGYRPYYTGPEVQPPAMTTTEGLADWDPNAEGPIPLLGGA
jgi:hypothetical protein